MTNWITKDMIGQTFKTKRGGEMKLVYVGAVECALERPGGILTVRYLNGALFSTGEPHEGDLLPPDDIREVWVEILDPADRICGVVWTDQSEAVRKAISEKLTPMRLNFTTGEFET